MTVHGPSDLGMIALRLEIELARIAHLHRLRDIGLDLDELVWPALGERHGPLADLTIARPMGDGAGSRLRSLETDLRVGIELRPRRPRIPFMQIVHLREDGFRRRRDLDRAFDAELRRLHRDHDYEDRDDHHKRNSNLFQHTYPLPIFDIGCPRNPVIPAKAGIQ